MINKEALAEHYGDDLSIVKEIIGIFEDNYPKTLGSLKEAFAAKDIKNVELHSHTLKGMLSNFFAEELVAKAYKIEKLAHEGSLDGVEEEIANIESEIPKFVNEVKSLG